MGTTMSGSFTIIIVDPKAPGDKRSHSVTQHTLNSTIVLEDVELFGPGNISISGYEDVSFENLDFDLGYQPKKRSVLLNGGPAGYILPKKSDLMSFTATPFVQNRTKKAMNKKEAVDKVSGELGGTIGIKVVDIVAKIGGEQGNIVGAQEETEYIVHYLTGGLTIKQLPNE